MGCSYGFSSLTVEEMSVKHCSSNTLCYNMTRCEKNVIRPNFYPNANPNNHSSSEMWYALLCDGVTKHLEALPTDNRVRTFPVWPLFPASYLFHFSPPNSYHPDSLSGQKLNLFTSLIGKILKPHFVRHCYLKCLPSIFLLQKLYLLLSLRQKQYCGRQVKGAGNWRLSLRGRARPARLWLSEWVV